MPHELNLSSLITCMQELEPGIYSIDLTSAGCESGWGKWPVRRHAWHSDGYQEALDKYSRGPHLLYPAETDASKAAAAAQQV